MSNLLSCCTKVINAKFTIIHQVLFSLFSAFRPIVHEFKTWREISYETSLNQSPFDVPKLKTKSKTKLEIPCEQPSSNNDEETISLAIKRFFISIHPERTTFI